VYGDLIFNIYCIALLGQRSHQQITENFIVFNQQDPHSRFTSKRFSTPSAIFSISFLLLFTLKQVGKQSCYSLKQTLLRKLLIPAAQIANFAPVIGVDVDTTINSFI
jgi:hypothetical protein